MAREVADIARGLGRELGPLRRAVSRATRRAERLPDLPDNQVEVLRAVVAEPGLGTSAIAASLQLARPTVSNLLTTMRRAGLVELSRPRDDGRVVAVTASARAVNLLERFDTASAGVIADSLADLSAADRAALAAAVPALGRLNAALRRAMA